MEAMEASEVVARCDVENLPKLISACYQEARAVIADVRNNKRQWSTWRKWVAWNRAIASAARAALRAHNDIMASLPTHTEQGQVIPDVVRQSIVRGFPNDYVRILAEIRFKGGCDPYFYFNRWGMFVGVELDGYIHT